MSAAKSSATSLGSLTQVNTKFSFLIISSIKGKGSALPGHVLKAISL